MSERREWTRDERVLVLSLYSSLSFGQFSRRNREVIRLASLIGRSPSSVAMKLGNFAAIDPGLHRLGLGNISQKDADAFEEFCSRRGEWLEECVSVLRRLRAAGASLEEGPEIIRKLDQAILRHGETERDAVVTRRVGQSYFRESILGLYQHRCCVTGICSAGLLEAAHISGWSGHEARRLRQDNGLCLNVLFHRAYDRFLVSVTPDFLFRVSEERIACNGEDSFALEFFRHYEGRKIAIPEKMQFAPNRDFLAEHFETFLKQ